MARKRVDEDDETQTGEPQLEGESDKDYKARTVKNGPEPVDTRPADQIAPR